MEVIPKDTSVAHSEEEEDDDDDDDITLSSGSDQDAEETPTLVEFASSFITGKRKGSGSVRSAKRRPVKAAKGFLQKRSRTNKKALSDKEKKLTRADLKRMHTSSDRSVDSQPVKGNEDDTDEWIDQMTKGLRDKAARALDGLENVLN